MTTFTNTTNSLVISTVFDTVCVFVIILQPLVPGTHLLLFSFFCILFNSRRAAVVISGTELARQIQREIQRDVEELVAQGNMRPHLGVVLVGEDPASRTYVKNKTRAASILGKSHSVLPVCVMSGSYMNLVVNSLTHTCQQRAHTCCARASSVVPCRYFQWHSGAAKLGLPGRAAGADWQDEPWLEGQRPAGAAATSW